jgi:hypothetical protein
VNCKPGDLAVIVRSMAGNEGKFVTVLRWHGDYTYLGGDVCLPSWEARIAQVMTAANGSVWFPGDVVKFPDAWLKPIRPDGITDEEVRDLYAPKQTEAA